MKIEAGKSYRDATGEKVGPMKPTIYPDGATESWPWTVGADLLRFWRDDGTAYGADRDLVSEWTDEPTGPVITETVKRIVPGVYGIVRVGGVRYGKALIQVSMAERELWEGADAEQLRAAAATLLEIADALVKP